MTGPDRSDVNRGTAMVLVAAIAAITLALNLWELRFGLPAVVHSDYIQARQAVHLLHTGRVDEPSVYPLPLVYAYAGSFLASYGVGRALGWEGYADWAGFLEHLSRPEVHHAIGRAFGALCAACLAVGVYRLARVRFDRSVSVLGAAVAGFSPLLTIHAHQVRPHVPVIAVVVLAAPAVLRAAVAPGFRTGLLSGLATGITSAVFQAGLPFTAAALTLTVLFARPARTMARTLLGIGLGFAAGWGGLTLLATQTVPVAEPSSPGEVLPGAVLPGGEGAGHGYILFERHLLVQLEQLLSGDGGLVAGTSGFLSPLINLEHIGELWAVAEPTCALGFVAFVLLCVFRKRSWRDLLLYALPGIAIVVAIILIQRPRTRYSMYATPFLAPLAASAVLAIPAATQRWFAAGLLVLVPLASSIRCDVLLGRSHTRIALHEVLPALTETRLRVVVQADLLPSEVGVPRGVTLFPPKADYRKWITREETPRQTLLRLKPDVLVLRRDSSDPAVADLLKLGLVSAFEFGGDTAFISNDPGWVLSELWNADRPGPQIIGLVRPGCVERVRAALGP